MDRKTLSIFFFSFKFNYFILFLFFFQSRADIAKFHSLYWISCNQIPLRRCWSRVQNFFFFNFYYCSTLFNFIWNLIQFCVLLRKLFIHYIEFNSWLVLTVLKSMSLSNWIFYYTRILLAGEHLLVFARDSSGFLWDLVCPEKAAKCPGFW